MVKRTLLVALAAAVLFSSTEVRFAASRTELPSQLSSREFWRIVDTFSEPGGYFNSDNLVSNEDSFQDVVPELARVVPPGGVYLGVGPDQNFTYIAAVEPAMAFITDIRRGNLHVHLMYKALFELSANRAEFLARLFGRPLPTGLGAASTARELFAALDAAEPDDRFYAATRNAIFTRLTRHRGTELDSPDRDGIDYVYARFHAGGPAMTFVTSSGRRGSYPSFAALHTATDSDGAGRSYLSTEAAFQRVKRLQARNLIVPIVGDFAGEKALAAVAAYVRERGGVVRAFYTSNVEQYLFQDGSWDTFRANVARMPIDATSLFIRSCFGSCSSPGGPRAVTLVDPIAALLADVDAGRIRSYWDVVARSRTSRAE